MDWMIRLAGIPAALAALGCADPASVGMPDARMVADAPAPTLPDARPAPLPDAAPACTPGAVSIDGSLTATLLHGDPLCLSGAGPWTDHECLVHITSADCTGTIGCYFLTAGDPGAFFDSSGTLQFDGKSVAGTMDGEYVNSSRTQTIHCTYGLTGRIK